MVARPLVVGRYAIYDKIASGGMASVHFGRLTSSMGFTRTVAVKRLHPHLMEDAEFLRALLDEARLAARIHHPNVVPTLDVVATDTDLLLVMDYVRGESLAQLLLRALVASEDRPSLPIVSAIAVGALQGLHAAHEATSDQGAPLGIVHRDVSPQNILVGIDGATRIIDFGVAKAAGRLQTTREGVVKGKISYMAPEQLGGDAVTPRTDVYAMAVVLWEMITGRKLFQGDDRPSLFGRVLAGVHAPPSRYAQNLPEGLDDVVMKGLRLDPESRFASAREMSEALARVVPPSLPTEVGGWVRKIAAESLAQRGAILAEIESESGDVPAHHGNDAHAVVSRIQRAPAGQGEHGEHAGHGGRGGHGGESDQGDDTIDDALVLHAPPAGSGSRPFRSRRLGVAALIVVALAGTFAWSRQATRELPKIGGPLEPTDAASPNPAGIADAAATFADAAPVLATAAATSAPPAPSDTAPTSSAPAPSASASAAAPAPSLLPRRPSSKAGRAPGPAPSAARDCNPNFFYDSAGQMRFKPECFH